MTHDASMGASPTVFTPVETEVLTASCTVAGEIIDRNDAWRATFGDEDDPWSVLSGPDRTLIRQRLGEAAAGSMVTNEILLLQHGDRDEPLPVLLNFLPVFLQDEAEQKSIGAIMITGEVMMEPASWTGSQTQRHRLETLGRMTMGIAHDFNNLLSGILGYTELLLSELDAADLDVPINLLESLRTIERAALDGGALIEKIQKYIRQEKETAFEALDLPSIIQDCVSLTRPYWYNEPRRQGIDIEINLDLHDVPAVYGSDVALREVFINLILNAVQALPQGGSISIATSHDEARGVLIAVEDTGVGMSEAVKERIFEPLYTTKGERGTGMGLAVAYGIVQEHDGTIDVESQLGKGTRFTFAFPPASEARTDGGTPGDLHEHEGVRILVVDDEEMVRSVLARLLTLRNHTVVEAASGPEALSLVESEAFDIVFADQAMPEMSGRELAGELRDRYPELPIVLLTGDTEVGMPDEVVDKVMGKPFQLAGLQNAIRELLGASN